MTDEYRDEGVSGTKDLDARPGLAALLDRVESNGIHVVLVERADRIARDLLVGEVILARFRDRRVKVIAVDSGEDLTAADGDPTRTLIRQVLGAVSQFEKSVTVLKLRAARDRKRAKGERVEGRKPFGHYPGEARVLEVIRDLRTKRGGKRLGAVRIAKKLNEMELPSRMGGPWSPASVSKILAREFPNLA